MIDGYGSQCGFCTPGIVMALAGHFEAGETSARRALTGNLCRCTGYWQILESAAAVDPAAIPRLAELYPEAAMLEELRAAERDEVRIVVAPRELYLPADLEAACRFKAEHPDCLVVAGATDVAVRRNKGAPEPDAVLALGRRIAGFVDAAIEGDVLHAGAGATWSHLLDLAGARVPALAEILERFGAPQIRNAGDHRRQRRQRLADRRLAAVPLRHGRGGRAGRPRRVAPRADRVVLSRLQEARPRPGELIAGLEIPLPKRGDDLRLYKMSRRRALDIASFTAAVLMRRSGDTIASARLAYGGVGPTVVRLPRAEAFLTDRPFTAETMRHAGEIAAGEITPWSDVRGSETYRRRLAENVLVKFFHEVTGPAPAPFEPFVRDPRPAGYRSGTAPAAG